MKCYPKLVRIDGVGTSEDCLIRCWSAPKHNGRRGHAVIEAALLLPCIVFLFVGAFDMGFYSYSLIGVENAVRVAVEYTATSTYTATDSSTACTLALNELATVPNLSGVTSCGALPLKVDATAVNGPDGAAASQVTVQYQSNWLIPIPGLLTGQLTITRVAQMRLRS
jgi:Flp pilus assembly protein TadG